MSFYSLLLRSWHNLQKELTIVLLDKENTQNANNQCKTKQSFWEQFQYVLTYLEILERYIRLFFRLHIQTKANSLIHELSFFYSLMLDRTLFEAVTSFPLSSGNQKKITANICKWDVSKKWLTQNYVTKLLNITPLHANVNVRIRGLQYNVQKFCFLQFFNDS